ncbi:MAG: MaoC family dehydratase [Betaproteobacteria bacterium]|nr:MAG: MaoC family dehydratase [Betaproteobacteria bacterium]
MSFSTPLDQRHFEDYVPGAVHEFGSVEVEETELISFARRFDPQPFHTDPEAAKHSPLGGIIASGWHTCSMMMRMCADHYFSKVASLPSPGLDELRFHRPVRPGDRLSVRIAIFEAKRSNSKPDRGRVRALIEVLNQNREVVMSMKDMYMIRCRNHP